MHKPMLISFSVCILALMVVLLFGSIPSHTSFLLTKANTSQDVEFVENLKNNILPSTARISCQNEESRFECSGEYDTPSIFAFAKTNRSLQVFASQKGYEVSLLGDGNFIARLWD